MTPQMVQPQKFDLISVVEDLFLILSPKEKEIIQKRFQLNTNSRMTLQKIGEAYAVTRERIRQIEKSALSKMRRVSENTKLGSIMEMAKEILQRNGGVLHEDTLLSEILKRIAGSSPMMDGPIIRLALSISADFEAGRRNMTVHSSWRFAKFSPETVKNVGEAAFAVLSKKKDVQALDAFLFEMEEYLQSKGMDVQRETIASVLKIDRRFKQTKEGVGLMAWRHVNPRSIRDKAHIVLKQAGEPLHFMEISNRIASAGFDQKTVNRQAVHNELIRDNGFVLVGRGLYALKEWGFKEGTVMEVIADILRKKSPLTKDEIVAQVLKQRQVKKGTISLNLQKSSKFERVGRAMYTLKG